jgi:hypothetical protein
MSMLQPQQDILAGDGLTAAEIADSTVEQQIEDGESRQIIPKVEPYGSEEIREVIIRRKQQEQAYIREDRARRQAYSEALDLKV